MSLYPGKCGLRHPSRRLLNAQEETCTKKYNLNAKSRSPMAASSNSPTPKAQGMLRKREQEDCKSQKIKEFAVRLCLLVLSEARHRKSHQSDSPHVEQNQDDTNGHAKVDNVPETSIIYKNDRQLSPAASGRNSLP